MVIQCRSTRWVWTLSTVWLLSSCSSPSSIGMTVASGRFVRIPLRQYFLEGQPATAVLGFTLRNPTTDTVFVGHCGVADLDWQLERLNDGTWTRVVTTECPEVAVDPIVLPPGDSITESATIREGPQTPRTAIVGTFRLLLGVYHSAAQAKLGEPSGLLPPDDRVSNTFQIAN